MTRSGGRRAPAGGPVRPGGRRARGHSGDPHADPSPAQVRAHRGNAGADGTRAASPEASPRGPGPTLRDLITARARFRAAPRNGGRAGGCERRGPGGRGGNSRPVRRYRELQAAASVDSAANGHVALDFDTRTNDRRGYATVTRRSKSRLPTRTAPTIVGERSGPDLPREGGGAERSLPECNRPLACQVGRFTAPTGCRNRSQRASWRNSVYWEYGSVFSSRYVRPAARAAAVPLSREWNTQRLRRRQRRSLLPSPPSVNANLGCSAGGGSRTGRPAARNAATGGNWPLRVMLLACISIAEAGARTLTRKYEKELGRSRVSMSRIV